MCWSLIVEVCLGGVIVKEGDKNGKNAKKPGD